jgi:hypothetical protein
MFINRLLPYSLTTICRWGLNSYTIINSNIKEPSIAVEKEIEIALEEK